MENVGRHNDDFILRLKIGFADQMDRFIDSVGQQNSFVGQAKVFATICST